MDVWSWYIYRSMLHVSTYVSPVDCDMMINDLSYTLGFQTPGEEVFGPQKHT